MRSAAGIGCLGSSSSGEIFFLCGAPQSNPFLIPLFSLLSSSQPSPLVSLLSLPLVLADMEHHFPIGLHGPLSNVFGGSFVGNLLTAMYVGNLSRRLRRDTILIGAWFPFPRAYAYGSSLLIRIFLFASFRHTKMFRSYIGTVDALL